MTQLSSWGIFSRENNIKNTLTLKILRFVPFRMTDLTCHSESDRAKNLSFVSNITRTRILPDRYFKKLNCYVFYNLVPFHTCVTGMTIRWDYFYGTGRRLFLLTILMLSYPYLNYKTKQPTVPVNIGIAFHVNIFNGLQYSQYTFWMYE